MPKPVVGDNGLGMHVHQSVWKEGKNLFQGQRLLGAIRLRPLLHRRHHQARKSLERHYQSGDNSYKRLVPGFEARDQPRLLVAQPLRRLPHPARHQPQGARVEVRFPDPTSNSYLAFAAMLMAGLDGVQNKIHPGDPIDKNMYRPAAGSGEKGPAGVLVARNGTGVPQQGPASF